MKNIKNYTLAQLTSVLTQRGFSKFSAVQIFEWIYRKGVNDFNRMSNISAACRAFLKENFYFSQLVLVESSVAIDATKKFLLKLDDGNAVETVVISQEQRNTICLSSQVGCKFNCKFCLSGQAGFIRDLTFSEIVDQYLFSAQAVAPEKISNIVFMGIGEPLDNFNNVVEAIKIFIEEKGLHIGKRKISISTCGLVPQIIQLADLALGVKLSISLHAADDDLRAKIMPINKRYPLKELLAAVKYFTKKTGYPVFFEYVLIAGVNTAKQDAAKLAVLVKGIDCKINLIPFNGRLANFNPVSLAAAEVFTEELKKHNIFFTTRKSKGQDISAACGQLRAKEIRDKR